MIISASYKTDIPTFYGNWFMNRLEAGFCHMINPYNRQAYKVDLSLKSVDAFVFWTKNIGPFMDSLQKVHDLGYPFMVQHTINGYPRSLETSVVNYERSINNMKEICNKFGPEIAVWRYDPVVFTSETPEEFHKTNFAHFASALKGYTNEVVISFAQTYRKTKNNMDRAATANNLTWFDPSDDLKRDLAVSFREISESNGMQLTICSQDEFLSPGIEPTKCVDADRLSRIAGHVFDTKLKGNRPKCGCYESRDIGEYDTCPHGCVYCYAVRSTGIAKTRYQEHDANSSFLFKPSGVLMPEDVERKKSEGHGAQIPLFPHAPG